MTKTLCCTELHVLCLAMLCRPNNKGDDTAVFMVTLEVEYNTRRYNFFNRKLTGVRTPLKCMVQIRLEFSRIRASKQTKQGAIRLYYDVFKVLSVK